MSARSPSVVARVEVDPQWRPELVYTHVNTASPIMDNVHWDNSKTRESRFASLPSYWLRTTLPPNVTRNITHAHHIVAAHYPRLCARYGPYTRTIFSVVLRECVKRWFWSEGWRARSLD